MPYISRIDRDPQQPLSGQPDVTRTQYRSISQARPQTPPPLAIHASEQPRQRADILAYRPGQPVSRPGPMPGAIERQRAMSQPTLTPARPSIIRIK